MSTPNGYCRFLIISQRTAHVVLIEGYRCLEGIASLLADMSYGSQCVVVATDDDGEQWCS